MPRPSATRFDISYRSTNWPPAEWPAITTFVRLGKIFLLAKRRSNSSTKSKEVRFGLLLRGAARSPAISSAAPTHLVRLQFVLAPFVVREEARSDHDGIVQRAVHKGRGCRRLEIVIGVPIRSVDHDQSAANIFIADAQREGAINHRARWTASQQHPLRAGRR